MCCVDSWSLDQFPWKSDAFVQTIEKADASAMWAAAIDVVGVDLQPLTKKTENAKSG